ncbi:MAG: ATP-binding protein [Anaerolineae bacterium]
MTAAHTTSALPRAVPTRLMLRQIEGEMLPWALPAVAAAGGLLVFGGASLGDPLPTGLVGAGLLLLTVAVMALREWKQSVAVGCLVAGTFIACCALAWGAGAFGAAVGLLFVPVGLAALFAGQGAGLGLSAAGTLLLILAPQKWLAIGGDMRTVAAISLWATCGLLWLAQHPLLTAVEWSWVSYERSRTLLEQARDYQVQLKQTLKDLADANLQLTRLHRLADGLRQAAEEARHAKEQFVANVSHELRTPLNMIVGFAEMILQAPETYGSLPQALLADLTIILRNSQHLSSLIDDVLDLSQIESGRMALTRERVPLAEVIAAAAAAVRPLYDSKGLYLRTEVPADLPPVFCDRTRIREVVLNLLSNAGRFTFTGGVTVRAYSAGAEVHISVTDTGPGIASEDQARLFKPFEQLDGSLRRRHGGSGLGLAISQSFVELHGGRLWVESTKGVGTTFHFRLPVDPPPAPASGAARWFSPFWHYEERARTSRAPVPIVRPRLVVLEDGHTLQRLLARYVDGVEVIAVTSATEAVTELAHVPAQALVVNTPSTSVLLDRLDLGKLPENLPVIHCSLASTERAADALGAADYLVKPISRAALLEALARLPERPRTILIIDDEPEALQLFWRMLASGPRPYRVLTASNGEEALAILAEEKVDCLLLDLAMPGMDGFQLLQRRRLDPALQHIPVIVTSARDPTGQPIVSEAVTITRRGGLGLAQVLAHVETACGWAANGQVREQ